jgi:hypothetical protein
MVKTRKNKKLAQKVMTIPQLRAAFERIDKKAMELKGKDPKIQIREFKEEWARVFSREVSSQAVQSYLAVKHMEPASRGKKTRKLKHAKMTGGAQLGYAPVAYTPGIAGPPFSSGNFPEYLTKGLTFYDTVNQHARMADCGVIDTTPKLLPGMGSNQAGGSATDFISAMLYKPTDSTVPPTLLQTARSNFLGMPAAAKPV